MRRMFALKDSLLKDLPVDWLCLGALGQEELLFAPALDPFLLVWMSDSVLVL